MSFIKIITIASLLASLSGCIANDPHILDGPGMEYVDSDYRNEYANCLPYDDIEGLPYLAICYLGSGTDGKEKGEKFINYLFKSLEEDKIKSIPSYEFDGNDWYLVVPRYYDEVYMEKGNDNLLSNPLWGTAFTVKCNSDITVSTFHFSNISYKLCADENGNLKNIDENVWDIKSLYENIDF